MSGTKLSRYLSNMQIQRAALLNFVVADCLNITVDLVRDLERLGYSLPEIERYSIRSIPSETQNIILAHSCLDRFGSSVLIDSQMFYHFERHCLDHADNCVCNLETWRLDLNPNYSRGLLLPIRESRYSLIENLLVYRHVRDTSPFILKLCADLEAAA